jgi:hypothetical protein
MRAVTQNLLVLFLFSFAQLLAQGIGQANYAKYDSYGIVDNLGNCVTQNCLLQTSMTTTGTNVVLTQVSSGFDGYVLGVDASGSFWTLPFATTSKSLWTKVPAMGSGAAYVAVRNKNEIYALFGACGASNLWAIHGWNGSSWRTLSGCLSEISVTDDDVLIGINYTNSLAYFTTNPGVTPTSWAQLAGGWTHIAGYNHELAFGSAGYQLYQINPSTNVYTVMTGAPPVSLNPLQPMVTTSDGYLFLRVANGSPGPNGNLYYYNFGSSNPTWVNIYNWAANLGGGASRNGLFFLDANGYPYHVLMTALAHSTTISGNYLCPPAGCPTGSYHTAFAGGNFPHGYNTATQATSSGAPASYLSATLNDVSGLCDPFFGDPASIECFVGAYGAGVNCSVMGNIFSSGGGGGHFTWQSEMAFTQAYWDRNDTAPPSCLKSACIYPVHNQCTLGTSPPDDPIGSILSGNYTDIVIEPTPRVTWRTAARCWRIYAPGPWICGPLQYAGMVGLNVPLAPFTCTHNP